MKIMCLNGWGGVLHKELTTFLQQSDPDVLCLQEVVHTPGTSKDWLTYKDGEHVLPQRANFFSDISGVLPDHEAIFCPAAQGVLWDEDIAIDSQWGLATFVRRELLIVEQEQAFVHKQFSPHSYGDHPRSRNAHRVTIFDYEKDRPVSILHTHGLRDVENGKADTPARRQQAEKLLHMIRRCHHDHPVIVCGDLNVEPRSETLEMITEEGFTELVTSRGFDGTRTASYKKPGRFADYLFVNAATAVLEFDVLAAPEVSDHCPLVLQI